MNPDLQRDDTAPALWGRKYPLLEKALQILRDARIVGPDEGLVQAPYTIWGMPRGTEGKRSGFEKANRDLRGREGDPRKVAPQIVLMGAPELGIRAAGLSLGTPEMDRHYDGDAQWLHERMEIIRDRGSVIYGGQWAVARFSCPVGVDTTHIGRLYEAITDRLMLAGLGRLLDMMEDRAARVIEFRSQADFRRMVGVIPDANSALWNLLTHPEFFVVTRESKGPITARTTAAFRVVEAITEESDAPVGAPRRILVQVSKAAVAMAVAQLGRMSEVLSRGADRQCAPEVADFVDWLWSTEGLSESGNPQKRQTDSVRRLARHLMLSAGGNSGYAYLLTPHYAASVTGLRVSSTRQHRHRAVQTLVATAEVLRSEILRLDSLGLQHGRVYLEAALKTILATKRSESYEGTPLPFGYDESPSLETLETHAELGWLPEETPLPESFQGDRRSSEGVSQVQRGVANPERCRSSEEVASQIQRGSVANPERCRKSGEVSQIRRGVALLPHKPPQTALFAYTYSFAHYKDCTDSEKKVLSESESGSERKPDQIAHIPPAPSLERSKKPDSEPEAEAEFNPRDEFAYWRTRGKAPAVWPLELLEALGQEGLLSGWQLVQVPARSVWSPEGAWAIYQAITSEKLGNPGGTLWHALTRPGKGERWLQRTGPLLRDAGWREVPDDGTPRECPTRKEGRLRLGRFRRLPLPPEGVADRERISREESELALVAEEKALAQRLEEQARRRSELEAARHTLADEASKHESCDEDAESGGGEAAAAKAWAKVLLELEASLPEQVFQWILPIRPTGMVGSTLHLRGDGPRSRMWILQELADEITEALQAVGLGHLRWVID